MQVNWAPFAHAAANYARADTKGGNFRQTEGSGRTAEHPVDA